MEPGPSTGSFAVVRGGRHGRLRVDGQAEREVDEVHAGIVAVDDVALPDPGGNATKSGCFTVYVRPSTRRKSDARKGCWWSAPRTQSSCAIVVLPVIRFFAGSLRLQRLFPFIQ
jgi:hypothetical protein